MCYQKVTTSFLFLLCCTVAVVLESSAFKMLNSDASNAVGVEENGDVKLFETGWINVTLDYPYKLEFSLCKNKCTRESIVCYPNSSSIGTGDVDFCPELTSYCGFKVEVVGNLFNFWNKKEEAYVGVNDICPSFVMASPEFEIGRHQVPSCAANLDENHMIQLYAKVHPSCPIWVKKAKIYLPPATTTEMTTTAVSSTPVLPPAAPASSLSASSDPASTSFVSKFWWIFLILAIVLVIIFIGIILLVIYKRRRNATKSKPAANVLVQPISTAPVQPSKVKAIPITELSEQSKKASVEYPADSLNRNCQIPPPVLKEMKRNYEEHPNREIFDEEVAFIFIPMEAMDESLKGYSQDCKRKLRSMKIKLDESRKIVSFPDEARSFLNSPHSAATLSYYAFGAEYREYLPNKAEDLPKFSLPLLMVIALQPHFKRRYRRQAIACLRRRLPEIRHAYSSVEREAMPFPINAIEMIYQNHNKYFESLKKCTTTADLTAEDESEKQ